MILKRSEIVMIRRGRLWFKLAEEPKLKPGQVVHLRSSRRDKGFDITVTKVVPDSDKWRVSLRLGDCTEHCRFLEWTGGASTNPEGERGYTEERFRAMMDEPEAVSDTWLKRFAEQAHEHRA